MPNYCFAELHVRAADIPYGSRKYRLRKFWDWLRADYSYSVNPPRIFLNEPILGTEEYKKIPTEHHIGYRVFSANGNKEWFEAQGEEDDICLYLQLEVAWSVHSTMMISPMGYIMDYRKENIDKYGKDPCLSLAEACAELGCSCELYSGESGMAFSEHILIDEYGTVLTDEDEDYLEIYIGDSDTFEDYKKYCDENGYDLDLTKEEFEKAKDTGEDCVCKCKWCTPDGLWNFTIV